MSISLTRRSDAIVLYDRSNGRRLAIETDDGGECSTVDPPPGRSADVAVQLRCRRLKLPECPLGHVRDADGTILETIAGSSLYLRPSASWLEFHGSIKLELHGLGSGRVVTADGGCELAFDRSQRVVIAARSLNDRPPGTVPVSPTPAAVIRALSTFGTGLLTTSVERSFPTMRRPPPRLEVDGSPADPEAYPPPSTGIHLIVPPTWDAAVAAAPLAYYLGARCTPGHDPRLETGSGFTHSLADSFVESAGRLLQQVFLLDVVVRTEGRYQIDLDERPIVEPLLEEDPATLYRQPIDRRLETYLAVAFEDLAGQLPSWPLVADVPSGPSTVPLLSPLAERLAVVRPIGDYDRLDGSAALEHVVRSRFDGHTRGDAIDDVFVRPPPAAAQEHVWFGPGVPLDASLGVATAYTRRPEPPSEEGPIEVVVVHNGDSSTSERDAVVRSYELRSDIPVAVAIDRDVSVAALSSRLRAQRAMVHYIGHVDDQGFRCTDGHLDARTLDRVQLRSFLLNGCHSVRQGRALVERGAGGGVVTFGRISDRAASTVGATMAKLLGRGFPLAAAIDIARTSALAGLQYFVVGDGSTDVAQPADGPPVICDAEPIGDDRYDVTVRSWLPGRIGMGIVAVPYLDESTYAIPPGPLATATVSRERLRGYLERYGGPVEVNGTLCWHGDDLDDLMVG